MMLVLLAVLLLVSQVGEVVGLPPNYEDIDMTTQFAGRCWCCWLCCCWSASWVKFPPSFVTVHDYTICRMMLVLLAVLLLVSQLGGIFPFFCNSA
jgi:hypothetical protein